MSKLTDEQIERLWYPSASIAEPGKRRVAFGRAIEAAAAEPLLQRIAELERQLEEARKDAERLNWLVFNPVEALDLFGHVTGDFSSWPKWIRQDIDAAM